MHRFFYTKILTSSHEDAILIYCIKMDWHAPFLKVVYHIRNGFARPVCRIFAKFTRKIRHIRQAFKYTNGVISLW